MTIYSTESQQFPKVSAYRHEFPDFKKRRQRRSKGILHRLMLTKRLAIANITHEMQNIETIVSAISIQIY